MTGLLSDAVTATRRRHEMPSNLPLKLAVGRIRALGKDVFGECPSNTQKHGVSRNTGSGLAMPYPWPNNPVELTAHRVRFFGYFLHFLLWAAAHREP